MTLEYKERQTAAQRLMKPANIRSLVLTTTIDIRYFTGFDSQLLVHSPTRPCILIVQLGGSIIVCPDILAHAVRQTCVDTVLTYASMRTTEVDALCAALGSGGRCATPMGPESHVDMPLKHLQAVMARTGEWVDATPLVHSIRVIKAPTEIANIQRACEIASHVLHTLSIPKDATERDVARQVRIGCLAGGASTAPFVVVTSGPDGYESIVNDPTDRRLRNGDVVAIDVGCTYAGYWCDFNRNYAIGTASDQSRRANELLWDATERGLAVVRPGNTFGDVWAAMTSFLIANGCDASYYEEGRQGHGLGHTLTEQPSVCRGEPTVLQTGMVLTLEPSMLIQTNGSQWVHEENLVVTDGGYALLSVRAPRELPVLSCRRSPNDSVPDPCPIRC